VSPRIRVALSDAQYSRLQRESQRTGIELAELVRRAVAEAYRATGSQPHVDEALRESFGAWAGRDLDGAAYVAELRRGWRRWSCGA